MQPAVPPIIPVNPRPRKRLWPKLLLFFCLAIVAALTLLAIGVIRCLRVGGEAQALRRSVMKAAPADWDKQIEIGIGAIPVTLVRAGLSLVELDAEARTAIQAVRGAEVGVYELRREQGRLSYAALLEQADQAMAKRACDRIVGVVSSREVVGIYVPRTASATGNLKVCFLVIAGRQLVVGAVRVNPGKLVELAELAAHRSGWRRPAHRLAGL
jgi:hypothetical protein